LRLQTPQEVWRRCLDLASQRYGDLLG